MISPGALFKAPKGARLKSRRPDHNEIGTLVRQSREMVCIEFERYCLIVTRPFGKPLTDFLWTCDWLDIHGEPCDYVTMCSTYAPRPTIYDSIFNSKALEFIFKYAEDILTHVEDAAFTCIHAERFWESTINLALESFESATLDQLDQMFGYYDDRLTGKLDEVYVRIPLFPGQFIMLSRYEGRLGRGVRISVNVRADTVGHHICIEDRDPEQGREFLVWDVDEFDEPIEMPPFFDAKPLRHRYV